MGSRQSRVLEIVNVALEVVDLLGRAILALQYAYGPAPILKERATRQMRLMVMHGLDTSNVWFAMLSALLEMALPIFDGHASEPRLMTSDELFAFLGHAPKDPRLVDVDVATQILQITSHMLQLSGAGTRMTSLERLDRQQHIASSVLVVEKKVYAIADELSEDEFQALRRLFAGLFSPYNSHHGSPPKSHPNATQYGTLQKCHKRRPRPRMHTQGRYGYFSAY